MNATDSGAYVLVVRVDRSVRIRVGALGLLTFAPGWYAYVGSAFNGLSARVARHMRLHKAKRWHIDYLRPFARGVSAFLFPSHRDIECVLARKLCRISSDQISRFGSSDCSCLSHLFYFDRNPVFMKEFRLLLNRRNFH
jgi:sugar fermentation stimulation protein A